ncbi:hypothetical protein Tco_0240637 [Tanacetum coccineum]
MTLEINNAHRSEASTIYSTNADVYSLFNMENDVLFKNTIKEAKTSRVTMDDLVVDMQIALRHMVKTTYGVTLPSEPES